MGLKAQIRLIWVYLELKWVQIWTHLTTRNGRQMSRNRLIWARPYMGLCPYGHRPKYGVNTPYLGHNMSQIWGLNKGPERVFGGLSTKAPQNTQLMLSVWGPQRGPGLTAYGQGQKWPEGAKLDPIFGSHEWDLFGAQEWAQSGKIRIPPGGRSRHKWRPT